MLHKTLIAFAAAAALGCLPMATTALAAHGGSGGSQRRGHVGPPAAVALITPDPAAVVGGYGGGYVDGPIYDSCAGYGYGYGYGPGYG